MPSRKRHRRPRAESANLEGPNFKDIWQVGTPATVPLLIDEILDPGRYRPLLVVSQATDTSAPRVDVTALRDEVGDAAYVAVLHAGEATWAFTHRAPDRFRVYGGGTRLFWPHAHATDATDRHPLFVTRSEDESPRTVSSIVRFLREKGYLPDERTTVTAPPWHSDPGSDASTDAARMDRLVSDVEAANERAATLATENSELKKTVHSLTDQVSALEQRLHARNVFTDPVAQLRHEIEHAWLTTYAEAERDGLPLAPFTFGPDFLTSVETLEGVERDKIVATCVDVLTRRAWEINGRQARQMRTSPMAGAALLTRSSDGAAAWRCNIQVGTASARRLMWWELPDGTIELAVAALHDDVAIR